MELKAVATSLLEAPLPDGWRYLAPERHSTAPSDAPADPVEVYRLERAAKQADTIGPRVDRLVQSLLFPMFTEAELEMLQRVWVDHQRRTRQHQRKLRVPAPNTRRMQHTNLRRPSAVSLRSRTSSLLEG